MHWQKLRLRLKHYANELYEEGYKNEAQYVRNELMSQIEQDANEYNERGKDNLAKLLDEQTE